jgi:hypothetical protein
LARENTRNQGEDDLADDFSHPIRQVHIFDTVLPLQGGGAYIGVVVASPLDDTQRSITRLREKLRFYLENFFTTHGRDVWGTPKAGKMRIYVNIHPDSSTLAFRVLDDFREEALHRGVHVIIRRTLEGPVGDH